MATIIFKPNLFDRRYDFVQVIEDGSPLIEHLMNFWQEGAPANLRVYENFPTEETLLSNEQLITQKADGQTVYYAVNLPSSGIEVNVGYVIIGLLIGVVAGALIPLPTVSTQSEANTSNSITGQTNLARPDQRVPEAFGKNSMFPDLGANSVSEWRSQVQYVTELLVLGVGFYDPERLESGKLNLRSGETLLDDMVDASYEIFDPNEPITDILDLRSMNEVDGQEIAGVNAVGTIKREFGTTYWFDDQAPLDDFINVWKSSDWEWLLDNFVIGDKVLIIFGNVGNDPEPYTITDFDEEIQRVYFAEPIEDSFGLPVYSSTWFSESEVENFVGFFRLPTKAQQIWIDLKLPRGLSDNDSDVELTFDIIINLIDRDTEAVKETVVLNYILKENTYDELNFTYKLDAQLIFLDANPSSVAELQDFYNVGITHTSLDSNDVASPTTLQWTRCASVTPVVNVGEDFRTFPDSTIIRVETRATAFTTSLQEREFNGVFTRKLPVYDPNTNSFSVNLVATSQMMDALFYMAMNDFGAGLPLTDIDTAGIYEIQQLLNTQDIIPPKTRGNQGEFNYIFSEQTSPDQDIVTITNACRCFVFRDGQTLKITYDNGNKFPTALFNRRNKTSSETKSLTFDQSTATDGIRLKFYDSEEEFIERTYEIPINRTAKQPIDLNIGGITNWEQAYRRGRYEYNRILFQRINTTIETAYDGRVLALNDLVLNVDNIGIKLNDGNVVDYAGRELIISHPVEFTGGSYTITLRNPQGTEIYQTGVSLGSEANRVIIADLPPFELVSAGTNNEIGTLYSIVKDSDSNIDEYLLSAINVSDQFTTLTMVNYTPRIYEYDSPAVIPPKNDELNID